MDRCGQGDFNLVHALLCEKEAFCEAGGDLSESELLELRQRKRELEDESTENDEAAQKWAESVKIFVRPFGPEIVEEAANYLRARGTNRTPNEQDIQNRCRHRYSNYESLLREGDDIPGHWYAILRPRLDELIADRLKAVLGKDGWSFSW